MTRLRVRLGKRVASCGVVMAAAAVITTGCGDGTADNLSDATIGEEHLARAEAAVSTVATFSGLLAPAGSTDLAEGGAAGVVSELAGELLAGAEVLPDAGGGGALNLACPAGGAVQISCNARDGNSVWRVVTSECRLCRADGQRRCLNIDGAVTAALAGGSCQLALVPEELARMNVLGEDLSVALTDTDGNVLAQVSANGTVSAESADPGCLVPNGTLSLDGSLTVVAPRRGVDVSFTAEELSISGGSDGSPCTVHGVVDGGLAVDDRAGARGFSGTFNRFAVGVTPVGGRSADVTVEGGLASACLGGLVEFHTHEALRFTLGRICPSAGRVAMFADSGDRSVAFTATGAVQIDADGDGVVDEILARCTDEAAGRCTGQ